MELRRQALDEKGSHFSAYATYATKKRVAGLGSHLDAISPAVGTLGRRRSASLRF